MSLTPTPKMKSWLVEHKGLSAEASDSDAAQAATDALLDDDNPLTSDKFTELQSDPDAQKGNDLADTLKGVLDRLDKIEEAPKETSSGATSDLAKVFAGSARDVRVIGAHEQYDSTKSRLHYPDKTGHGNPHPLAGLPAYEGAGGAGATRRPLFSVSEQEKAVNGAFIKFSIMSQFGGKGGVPYPLQMTDHDNDLIKHALHESKWSGVIHGEGSEDEHAMAIKSPRTLTGSEQKAILDDAQSGGLEIAPIAFDDALITIPVLFGEFFPSVNVVNITRGRRIEGGSVASVTINSGGGDGTNIPLENTSGFISAFDTTIHVADGAIEFGLDFLGDSPTNIMDLVQEDYGRQMLKYLDDQIVSGDGTTEPEGVLNATGTVSVTADNGATGPPTVGDYESLLFGVAKNFKTGHPSNRILFGANETTYRRARGIAVGATDQRRVFGMTHSDYMLFGHPYAINESFTNRQSLFGVFPRYRMYRRLAPVIKVTTEGKTLTRANLMLMTIRARFGGQVEDGSAFAVNITGQS